MAVETLLLTHTEYQTAHRSPRWQRRLSARLRLLRMALRRDLSLAGLDARQRADIGRQGGGNYPWLEQLMRGVDNRH